MLCEPCVRADPAAAAPPLPWESTDTGWFRGLSDTAFGALLPNRTAPAFFGEALKPGIRFALLTLLPLLVMRGIIPFTRTIRFGPSFQTQLLGSPDSLAIALDVMAAAGLSILVGVISIGVAGAAYVSLSAAYGAEGARRAALRFMLYRGWLLPLAGETGLFSALISWGLPLEPSGGALSLAFLVAMAPLLLYFIASRAAARLASGVAALPSFAVAVIPFVILALVEVAALTLLGSYIDIPAP